MTQTLQDMADVLEGEIIAVEKRRMVVGNAQNFVAQARALGFEVTDMVGCGRLVIEVALGGQPPAELPAPEQRQLPKPARPDNRKRTTYDAGEAIENPITHEVTYHSAPSSENQTKPKPRKPRPQIWSPDMVKQLVDMMAEGVHAKDIAQKLGSVTTQQVYSKASHVRDRINARTSELKKSTVRTDELVDVPAAPPKKPENIDLRKKDPVPATKPTIETHLDGVGNSKLWTPKRDFELCDRIEAGFSLQQIAKSMSIDVEDLEARWQALCPNRNDMAFRGGLLLALKRRAG